MAIIEGGVFDFDAQAPHIKTACLIHEYRTAESVTEKFGIEGVPSLYVAELRDLFLLETRDGGFEYLEIDHRQYLITPDQPFYKCYHSENLIWDFVRLDTSKDGPPETLEITGTLMQRTDL